MKRRKDESYEQYKARRKANEKRLEDKKKGKWVKKFDANFPNRKRAKELKAKINKMGGVKEFLKMVKHNTHEEE